MKSLSQPLAKFSRLSLRERLLAAAALTALLYFVSDLALLGPQQKAVKALQKRDAANQTELATLTKVLAEAGQPALEPRTLAAKDSDTAAEYRKQIAEARNYLGLSETAVPELGTLIKGMLAADPRLTLVSLKTLPANPFYAPSATESGIPATDAPFLQKTLYRQGIELSVKGSYPALVSYLENLQKYPGRLFWADANLDVSNYPDAVLKVVIVTLSEQSSSPLR